MACKYRFSEDLSAKSMGHWLIHELFDSRRDWWYKPSIGEAQLISNLANESLSQKYSCNPAEKQVSLALGPSCKATCRYKRNRWDGKALWVNLKSAMIAEEKLLYFAKALLILATSWVLIWKNRHDRKWECHLETKTDMNAGSWDLMRKLEVFRTK